MGILLGLLDFIAWGIFFIRYIKEEEGTIKSIKSIIGWMVTAAIMCILQICNIMSGEISLMTSYYTNFCTFLINFVIAVYALIRGKRKKVKNK